MRRHLADASWLFGADIVARALNFVAVAWLARILEPSLFGTIVIGAAVLDYALLLCDWGLKTLGARETALPERSRRFQPRTIFAARLVLSLAVFAIANVALLVVPVEPALAILIRVYLLGLLPYALLFDWYHQGRGAYMLITFGRAAGSLLLVAGAFVLVRMPEHAARVPWIFVASMSATSLVMIVGALRTRERLVPGSSDFAAAPSVLRGSTALGVAALFGQTFIVLPPIVAGRALGAASAGVLYAALRIVMIVLIIDRVFGTVYLPALTRVWDSDRERAPARLDAAFRVVTMLGVGASTLCMIFAANLIELAFGERYAGGAGVLTSLAPFVAATLLNTFFAYGLIAIGRERLYLRSGVRSGLLFVVLLLVGTPLFGLIGTALAMVIGESVMTLLLYFEFRRHVRINPLLPLAVCVSVGATLFFASRAIDAIELWHAPLYAVAFAGAVLLLRGIRIDDVRTRAR